MMNTECFIIKDLLPLYNEGLVQAETSEWIEAHLKTCPDCKENAILSKEPITIKPIKSPVNHDKMMSKITFKLSLYQMIFVGLSFFFAIKTSMLNDSFRFILSYTVLGLIMYLFYRSFKMVTLLAFVPIFIWSLATSIPEISNATESLLTFVGYSLFNSFVLAVIHLAFAISGAVIGLLVLKLRGSGRND